MKVSVNNLSMHYHDADRIVKVFSDLSLEIESGASLAIVGKSGVGKTTLLNIIAGLDLPLSGQVSVGDFSVTGVERGADANGSSGKRGGAGARLAQFRGRNIGYVFQFHHLFAEFDAVENVALPLFIQRMDRGEALDRAESLLKQVGLADRLHHRPSMLSGGEQQRVAIARAMSARPGVLLADEPTGNLDFETGAEIGRLLVDMQKTQGITLITVTHSLEFASLMDRVVEMTSHGIVERKHEELVLKR